MTVLGDYVRPSLLAVIGLVFLELGGAVQVGAYTAVVVYDHGFARQVRWTQNGNLAPVNKTSTFTQNDAYVYAYAQAAFVSAKLTWMWYDPDGRLYDQTSSSHAECGIAPCGIYSYTSLAGSGAARIGRWRVDLLVDGLLVYSDHF